ncbi:MMPL family transporter [Roseomonas xinghualingensis]|uniref:hopanoid transporter HpnN n=1 Tax=Roseomonas xinghualingensis TaxID=2986475 RepID=UPI0021F15F08|nr:MMPL family transporter [Roseomonas sp. SXEYE001]MCV4206672.1 MMPL family transporter [Roseomonas sp. SXEYE001]
MPHQSSLTGRIVAASCRHPWLTLFLAFLLASGALFYTTRHFAMTTDTAELISTDQIWRQRELAYAAAFPQQSDLTLVVIDGANPELADAASTRLAKALESQTSLFRSVRQAEGGPFFARNGLLLLPLEDVQATTEKLIEAQPFLGPLAADPSLRGVLTSLSNVLEGVRRGDASLADIEPAMTALAPPLEAAVEGRPAFFSWRSLFRGTDPGTRETRRFLLVQPVMDYGSLQPGAAAARAIRETARELGLDPAHGVTLRLTGSVPLADEEFASLAEDAELVTGAMLLALVGILWLAVRSARFVIAILATTLLGLVITAGLGLMATGRFNLISVAFIPLFVGLGVDFSIQFSVRCLAERVERPDLKDALTAAGRSVGRALTLAAVAIAAGFFAFLPTTFIGVAELGAIAGLGMIVALVLSVTLLPALLVLMRPPPGGQAEVGYPALAPVEAALTRHRRVVLAISALAALGCIALLPLLRFDFNPLHLRSPRVESMSTLQDLMKDQDRTPNTISILAPSLEEADALAQRLAALPEVSRTITLSTFIPSRQEEKLALIQDAAMFLQPVLEAVEPLPPPNDEEVIRALSTTADALRRTAGEAQDPPSLAARHLAELLDRLRAAPPSARAAAAETLVTPLRVLLNQTRAMLQAAPITRDTLPPDLVADWITQDGRARLQLSPSGDSNDNETLRRFSEAIQSVAPDATGPPISIREAGDSIVTAFLQAGILSGLAITLLLALVLRRARDVVLTMLPVLLSGLLTLASCVVFDLPLNFANIIALPLLFGIGVAFNIYFVMAWRAGEHGLLQSSLTRAVVFSAMTTATAFGALWLSSHPGTASMGRLLMVSLGWELLVTLIFRPALLAKPPAS